MASRLTWMRHLGTDSQTQLKILISTGNPGSDPGVVLNQGDVGFKTCSTGFLDNAAGCAVASLVRLTSPRMRLSSFSRSIRSCSSGVRPRFAARRAMASGVRAPMCLVTLLSLLLTACFVEQCRVCCVLELASPPVLTCLSCHLRLPVQRSFLSLETQTGLCRAHTVCLALSPGRFSLTPDAR